MMRKPHDSRPPQGGLALPGAQKRMHPNTFVRALLLFAALAPIAASAGAQFSAVTRNEMTGGRFPAFGNSSVRGAVEGDRGRLEYLAGGIGSLPKGTVVVTTDGARTQKVYNVEEHTCGDSTSAPGSTPMRAQAASLARYENLDVQKTLDETGPKIHGIATRHLRYAITYDVHAGDAAKPVHGTIDSELWLAPTLSDAAFGLWLAAAPRTGNPDADQRIAAGMGDARGAALKRVQRTSVQPEGGKAQATTSTLEVTKLAIGRHGDKALAPPFTCRNTPSGR